MKNKTSHKLKTLSFVCIVSIYNFDSTRWLSWTESMFYIKHVKRGYYRSRKTQLVISWKRIRNMRQYEFFVVWQSLTLANWKKRLTFSFHSSRRDLIYNPTLILVKASSYLLLVQHTSVLLSYPSVTDILLSHLVSPLCCRDCCFCLCNCLSNPMVCGALWHLLLKVPSEDMHCPNDPSLLVFL